MAAWLSMIAAAFAFFLTARVDLIASRDQEMFAQTIQSRLRAITKTVAWLGFSAVVVWAILSLPWPWVIVILLVTLIVPAFIITRNTFGTFYLIRPTLDVIPAVFAAFLWFMT